MSRLRISGISGLIFNTEEEDKEENVFKDKLPIKQGQKDKQIHKEGRYYEQEKKRLLLKSWYRKKKEYAKMPNNHVLVSASVFRIRIGVFEHVFSSVPAVREDV